MKRMHIGLDVADLECSIEFYSALFGSPPTMRKPDYAKWMLDDPRVNFSISTRERDEHAAHFGIQVETEEELSEAAGRLRRAGRAVRAEPDTVCCYHRSEKAWVRDPENRRWETFFTRGEVAEYGEGSAARRSRAEADECCP